MNRWKIGPCVLISCASFFAFGCSAASSEEAEPASPLGPQFVDIEGRRWIEVGPAKFSTPEEDREYAERKGRSYDSGPDFANMPIDDIVAKVKPRTLAPNGKEYTMDLDSAREFAEVIQRDARRYKGREEELKGDDGAPADGVYVDDAFPLDDERAGKIVYGADQRQQVFSPGTQSPWMRIGRHGSNTSSAGTVFKVLNQHTATSAAHVFNNGGSSWRTLRSIRFGDSLSQPSPFPNFGPPTESFW